MSDLPKRRRLEMARADSERWMNMLIELKVLEMDDDAERESNYPRFTLKKYEKNYRNDIEYEQQCKFHFEILILFRKELNKIASRFK